jgi:hypothetical protein
VGQEIDASMQVCKYRVATRINFLALTVRGHQYALAILHHTVCSPSSIAMHLERRATATQFRIEK